MNPYRGIAKTVRPGGTPAQKALRGALGDLLGQKPLADISVKELCATAYVARTTFYAYYENTDQVLEEIEDALVYDLIRLNDALMDPSRTDPEALLFSAETYQYVREHQKLFHALLIDHPDGRFIEKWKQGIKYHLWERLFSRDLAHNAEFILEVVASLTLSVHTWFLKNPDQDISREALSGMVARILQMLEFD